MNEGSPILYELERAIAREYKWIGYFPEEKKPRILSAGTLRAFVGTYSTKSRMQFSVIEENSKLLFTPPGQPPLEIHPESETKFFTTIRNAEV